jgi:chromosome condensin MukBEF MukE localization factor
MYNENRHIVSVFKDYLIFDDFSEYLKRFYRHYEATERLPRVFEFYEKYSKVFANYVVLPESKYMFKNIERKQKLIDEKH